MEFFLGFRLLDSTKCEVKSPYGWIRELDLGIEILFLDWKHKRLVMITVELSKVGHKPLLRLVPTSQIIISSCCQMLEDSNERVVWTLYAKVIKVQRFIGRFSKTTTWTNVEGVHIFTLNVHLLSKILG